ncbi:hypothetical protein SBRY_100080 [Actinacidiphila bryophytorum]|uniref:Uncharacterized protein n=1 Tax=Actinacidiphila bryophytorum TaxID=1436133 RepID=A0A9W4GY51_9ACTN|nr:hypothetical protein SBRY_100080 [Actinacidiphila bryophytorum]
MPADRVPEAETFAVDAELPVGHGPSAAPAFRRRQPHAGQVHPFRSVNCTSTRLHRRGYLGYAAGAGGGCRGAPVLARSALMCA